MFMIIGKNWAEIKRNIFIFATCKYFEYCLLVRDVLQSLDAGRAMRLERYICIA